MSEVDHVTALGVEPTSVGCYVYRLARAQHALLAAGLERLGLYPGQQNTLAILWEHGSLTQSRLAALVGVDTSTVCRTLQRLERAGLVERTACPEDRRSTMVASTAAGAALRDGLAAVYRRTDEQLLAGLEPAEREQFETLLVKLINGLERPAA